MRCYWGSSLSFISSSHLWFWNKMQKKNESRGNNLLPKAITAMMLSFPDTFVPRAKITQPGWNYKNWTECYNINIYYANDAESQCQHSPYSGRYSGDDGSNRTLRCLWLVNPPTVTCIIIRAIPGVDNLWPSICRVVLMLFSQFLQSLPVQLPAILGVIYGPGWSILVLPCVIFHGISPSNASATIIDHWFVSRSLISLNIHRQQCQSVQVKMGCDCMRC